ncbi:MAG: phospholipase A2 [Nakamurella sp.]
MSDCQEADIITAVFSAGSVHRAGVRGLIVLALVTVALLGVGAGAAGATTLKVQAITYSTESLSKFLQDRRAAPTPFDWSSDGCSTPNVGALSSAYNTLFRNGCLRHDFGYRNFGQDGLRLEPTESRRGKLDHQLLTDLRGICAKQPLSKRVRCLSVANTYYSGVRVFGGPAFFVG